MSDYESRLEDAKREEWADAHYRGRCPECGGPVYNVEYMRANRVEPESGRNLCENCGYEEEW